jgi:acetyl-CoA carboxylase biotin carboxyl carrier protein
MRDDVLIAAAEAGEDGKTRILAPAIGMWRDVPPPGSLLGPGSRIGTLAQGNRTRALLIPEGVSGTIADGLPKDRVVPVEFGQVLFHLHVLAAGAHDSIARSSAAGEASDLPAGSFGVAAPTDGIFYASPAPGAPPFVHVGSRIAAGQPVGLVEVMKTFNQILYGGAGLPGEAEVREVRCADREEIRAGQLLIVVGACSI